MKLIYCFFLTLMRLFFVKSEYSENFVYPTNYLDVEKWYNEGYTLVDGLITEDHVNQVIKEISHISAHSGGFEGVIFPDKNSPSYNKLVIDEKILNATSRLLNTTNVRLSQAEAWKKVGKKTDEGHGAYNNQDQRIHVDIHNHILVAAPRWEDRVSVAIIIYLSDYAGGGTGLVPRRGDKDEAYNNETNLLTPGGSVQFPWINDRNTAEKWMQDNYPEVAAFRSRLYEREVVARYNKGSVLFYRHDVWHRGRPLEEGKTRFIINVSFRRGDIDWWPSWNPGWPQFMYEENQFLEKFIVSSSVIQRNALGFPHPGHPYWNEYTLKYVKARYGYFGFDLSPYIEAFQQIVKNSDEKTSGLNTTNNFDEL